MGYISDCCGVPIPIDYIDYERCPDCGENCEVIDEEELEEEPINETNNKD